MPEMPGERTPRYVFGWTFTDEDQVELADKFGISKEDNTTGQRADMAFEMIVGMIPRSWRKVAAVGCMRDGRPIVAMCIYIGTNLSDDQIIQAQDEDFIGRVWRMLDTEIDPGWYPALS
ncbi:hypothetical protein CVT26_006992 [Gymnopilus dilepis]|uniref:Uncharacterized protein n=1 Tax=Gymnopilus dilepis TaxID=231916 RepID=A0A409W199_9AGAR|nr:hypothetical protein CVT26_006992 [Gymnopilus dilepis]